MMSQTLRKTMAVLVITALVIATPFSMVSAQKPEEKGNNGKNQVKVETTVELEEEDGEETESAKAWKAAKDSLIAHKDELEGEKDQLDAEKEELEAQAEEAKTAGNEELYQELRAEIEALKVDMQVKKEEMNAVKVQMKEVVRNKYTQEELDQLNALAAEIEDQNEDITVIPVENIISKKMNMKFDTPPVIKEGRTLIPVRAITEGFGAVVDWNKEDKIVTITKGDLEIVFQLNDGKVFVNDEESEIDVPAQIMNSRTIVPLRFIVEKLGLKIDYDQETGIVEIDDEEDVTEEEEDTTEEDTDNGDDSESDEEVVE